LSTSSMCRPPIDRLAITLESVGSGLVSFGLPEYARGSEYNLHGRVRILNKTLNGVAHEMKVDMSK
jgi:hypothetical protein